MGTSRGADGGRPELPIVMGGVEVDRTPRQRYGVSGLFADGEVAGGLHGSKPAGWPTHCPTCGSFGRRAGEGGPK